MKRICNLRTVISVVLCIYNIIFLQKHEACRIFSHLQSFEKFIAPSMICADIVVPRGIILILNVP